MGDPNWVQLVTQGRAKAIGVPWSDAELKAIHTDGILPEYVRRGALTKKDVEKLVKADKTPVEELTKAELLERARQNKAQITNDTGEADNAKAEAEAAEAAKAEAEAAEAAKAEAEAKAKAASGKGK